jgi:hypothetical protein
MWLWPGLYADVDLAMMMDQCRCTDEMMIGAPCKPDKCSQYHTTTSTQCSLASVWMDY